MRTFTLEELRTRARDLADMKDVDFVSDPELNRFLSAAYSWLYGKLVQAQLGLADEKEQVIATTGAATYLVPSDYYATIGVDWLNGSRYVELAQYSSAERNRYQELGGHAVAYRVIGTGAAAKVQLAPLAPAGQTYRHVYVPAAIDLVDDADTVDGVNGWEDLLVLQAAIRMLDKEESSSSALRAERQVLLDRIDEEAEHRSQLQSHRVRDVRGDEDLEGPAYDPADWRWR